MSASPVLRIFAESVPSSSSDALYFLVLKALHHLFYGFLEEDGYRQFLLLAELREAFLDVGRVIEGAVRVNGLAV